MAATPSSRAYAVLDEEKHNRFDANERMRQHLAERSQSEHVILELEPDFDDELSVTVFTESRHSRYVMRALVVIAASYLCYLATKLMDATIVPPSPMYTNDMAIWSMTPICVVFGGLTIWTRTWRDGYSFACLLIFELFNLMGLIFSFSLACWLLLDVMKRNDTITLPNDDTTSHTPPVQIPPHTPELGWLSWTALIIAGFAAAVGHFFILRANSAIWRLNHGIIGRWTPWESKGFVVPMGPFFDYYYRAVPRIVGVNIMFLVISIVWTAIQPSLLWQSIAVHIVATCQWYEIRSNTRAFGDAYKSIDIILPLLRFIAVYFTEVALCAARLMDFGSGGVIFMVAVYAGFHMIGIVAIFFFARRFDPFVDRFFEQRKRTEYARTLNLKDLPTIEIIFGNEVVEDSITQVMSRDVNGFFTTDLFTGIWKQRRVAIRLGRSHYLRKSSQLTRRDEDDSKEVIAYLNAPVHRNVVQTLGVCVDFASSRNAARTFAFFMENLVTLPSLHDIIVRSCAIDSKSASSEHSPASASTSVRHDSSTTAPATCDATPPLLLQSWYSIGQIARDIGNGLSHLHGHGILHRELVSKNVWLRSIAMTRAAAAWADAQQQRNGVRSEDRVPFEHAEVELADLSIDTSEEPDWCAVLSDGMLARQLNHQLTPQQQQMRAMMSRVDAAAAAAAAANANANGNGNTTGGNGNGNGSSGIVEEKLHNVGGGGSLTQLSWLPPECQLDTNAFTTKSDVYLWSCIIWDMLVCNDDRALLFPVTLNITATIHSSILQGKTRVPIAIPTREPLANLLLSCWNAVPTARPSIDDALRTLRPLLV